MSFTLLAPPAVMTMEFASRPCKLFCAAKLAGVKLEVDKNFEMPKSNECDAYMMNVHPLGRVPGLKTPDGYLFESNAILRHLCRQDKSNQGLLGRTAFESSQVDQWLDFCSGELDCHIVSLMLTPVYGLPKDEAREKNARECLSHAVSQLDCWLENRTFLVGERLTAADLAVGLALYGLCKGLGEKAMESTKIARYYKTVTGQPVVAAVLKDMRTAAAASAPKKEEKKAEKKPAPVAEEEEAPVEKKKPNPLDALPPSDFVLDAFKREYSNKDTRSVAAPYFFQNYDPKGYSCFWCNYKYNDELGMQFMTANLIRGWFQRMDRLHKYAFGCVLIIGEDKKHEISGFFVFRGKGMPEIMLDVDDCEHYTWTEIADINKEKEKITDYLCWEGPTIKAPVLEGRVFK